MLEDITQLTGAKKGLTSIVLVGVHGNEQCGVKALQKILPKIRLERGRVLFGYGNPRAITMNKRFTEANLNRMFKDGRKIPIQDKKSYEYQRAQLLKKYLDQADALLDVHASNTPNSNPFIICTAQAEKIIPYLPARIVVTGFDQVQPGGTDCYMNSQGKIGICIECGYLKSKKATDLAEKSILAFLQARGHLPKKQHSKKEKQKFIHMSSLYLTKTNSFTLSKPFADFEKIKKGQVIGTDGQKKITATTDGVILFARNREKIGDEAFLFGKNKDSLV